MSTYEHECPNCGAMVLADAIEGEFTCHKCGDQFSVEIEQEEGK